ncbi:MAG: putative colanic acid biosynthesis acetyltransferase [Microcoleaceae cyanobacterium]
MRLSNYTTGAYSPGAPLIQQILWFFIGDLLTRSDWLPVSGFKVFILRCFGAKIGQGVRIKPGVRVKFPWRLTIGDYVWIGENVWIDNLVSVTLESHVCLSQDVYLCTGNHDWSHPGFQLVTGEIYLEESSWIAARSTVGPGVRVGRGAVLGLGSVTGRSLEPMTIYVGNPAQPIKQRVMQENIDQAVQSVH